VARGWSLSSFRSKLLWLAEVWISAPSAVKWLSLISPCACAFTFAKNCCAIFLVQQPLPVLAERGVIPHRLIDLQAEQSAEQQVVIQSLHQSALIADGAEDLLQQRPEQPLD
jgi:hypothetical protein